MDEIAMTATPAIAPSGLPARAAPGRPAVSPLPRGDQTLRIRAFLRDPEAGIDALGLVDGAGRDSLDLLDRVSASQKRLNELNRSLVPLIARFRKPTEAGRFWRWFTGAQLEHELSFNHVCREVEASAELGIAETEAIRELIDEMARDRSRLDGEIAAIEEDIALGELLATERFEKLRALTGRDAETWQRLARRIGNLEAMATALRLTQRQYGLAIEHGKTVVARFDEIRTLLIPIWYQRMGFALFARRAGATDHEYSDLDPTR